MSPTTHAAVVEPEQAEAPPTRTRPGRGLLTWLGLVALVASAVVGSNVFLIRERLFGSTLPDPVRPAVSRGPGAPTPSPTPEPTALRSTPWWQDVVTLEGTGTTTSAPFTIDQGAIQWRVKATCGSGRLLVRAPEQPRPVIDATCPQGGTGFQGRSGSTTFEVSADGPWRLEVAQRIDLPLVEPPLPAMTAEGTTTLASGTFYKIDRTGAGTVTIFDQADGRYTVRLDDFFVSPASQLQLRLSTLEAPGSTEDYLGARSQLLAVLDVTAGSLNYTAPVGVDPTEFRSLVVWDPAIDSAYAAASLGPARMTTLTPPLPPTEALPRERPQVTLRGRSIPVVLPKLGDPRLKLSATIFTLTLLGLTVLNFQVSIPQILLCILLSAAVEIAVTYRRDHILVWPASAIQTGVSVAFIFRVGGTEHGDYWSLRGLHLFALVIVLSLLPKYLIRRNGRHVFNPSNVGLAWALLLIGPSYVFSEHLWWAPLGAPVLIAMAVIFGGALWVLRQVRMIPTAVAFLATFFVLIAIFAVSGRSYYATWHDGPVGGKLYWLTIALSPELLIFVFFMITDPQTAPKPPLGRIIYAVATAVVAAGLILVQPTEFGIKVAILSSLLVTCALVPAIETLTRRIQDRRSGAAAASRPAPRPLGRRLAASVRNPVLVAIAVVAFAGTLNTALLALDENIVLIERGLTPRTVQ